MSGSLTRRALLRGGAPSGPPRLCPPGVALSDLAACSGCGECAKHCPTGIVLMVDGLPSLDLSCGECTFCGQCAEHCPEPVFPAVPARSFAHVMAIGPACLPLQGVDCQACRDACPTEAIRFRPRRGGPFLPELDSGACTGCGACLSVCPAGAIAIENSMTEMADA